MKNSKPAMKKCEMHVTCYRPKTKAVKPSISKTSIHVTCYKPSSEAK